MVSWRKRYICVNLLALWILLGLSISVEFSKLYMVSSRLLVLGILVLVLLFVPMVLCPLQLILHCFSFNVRR
jgi:hypothetical protein